MWSLIVACLGGETPKVKKYPLLPPGKIDYVPYEAVQAYENISSLADKIDKLENRVENLQESKLSEDLDYANDVIDGHLTTIMELRCIVEEKSLKIAQMGLSWGENANTIEKFVKALEECCYCDDLEPDDFCVACMALGKNDV